MKQCKKCNIEFEIKKGLVNYCSLKCRNSRDWSDEHKQKVSDTMSIPKEGINIFQETYNKTKSLKQTAKILNVHPKTVKKYVTTIKVIRKTNYEYTKKRRKNIKILLVEYKGGKCFCCSYDRCVNALGFHHIDPEQKNFNIGHKGKTLAFEKMKEEVDKCVLLCSNCHRELHAGLITLNDIRSR